MNKPTNREELRRFLGLVAYVAKFLPGHAHVSAPLRELLREESVWAWSPAQDEAFQRLKEMTSTAPVLAYYSPGAPTIVSADASSYGIGAVLFEIQEDGRRAPVTYVSRSLSATEKRYSQIEKEALAMSWAFEKFHCYVLGSQTPTVVETDHKPLQTIMNVQQLDECPPRLMRMKFRLLRYCYTVQYVPGKTLAVADALSRAPVDAAEDRADTIIADLVEEHVSVVSNLWPASDRQLQRIRDETLKDPQLATLLAILKSEWPTTSSSLPLDLRQFWDSRHLFTQVDGIILRGIQIVIPRSMRPEMLQRAHEGHLGIVKTKHRVREVIWWPGMSNQIEQMVLRCETCIRFRNQQRREPFNLPPSLTALGRNFAVDLFEIDGDHYVLVMDYYSRFPELRQLSSTRSGKVISALKEIFACHGVPCELVSDNGPQFSSEEFHQFAFSCGFQHMTSSPRYPRGNGLIERGVQTIKGLLRKAHFANQDISYALLAYRSTPHETTSVSPAQLLMGRRLRTTLPSTPAYLTPQVVQRKDFEENHQRKKDQQAVYYNKRNGARPLPELHEGDSVLVWDLVHRDWRLPAVVLKRVNNRSYMVRLAGGAVMRRNRHQLQFVYKSQDVYMEDVDDEPGCAEDAGEQHGRREQVMDKQQVLLREETQVTRSGRAVRLPGWRKDYTS